MTTPYQRTQAVLLAELLLMALKCDEMSDGDLIKLQKLATTILEHFPRHADLVQSAKAIPILWQLPMPSLDQSEAEASKHEACSALQVS